MTRIPTLSFPVDGVPTGLCTDASDIGCGAVLEQLLEGNWVPIEFFSYKFSSAERNYSTFDRELLAAYVAISHF